MGFKIDLLNFLEMFFVYMGDDLPAIGMFVYRLEDLCADIIFILQKYPIVVRCYALGFINTAIPKLNYLLANFYTREYLPNTVKQSI